MINNWSFEYEKPESSCYVSGNVAIHSIANSFQTPFMSSTVSQDGFCRLWDSRDMGTGCAQIAMLNQIGTAVTWSRQEESQCLVGLADGQVVAIDWRQSGIVSSQQMHSARVNSIRAAGGEGGGPSSEFYATSSDDKTSVVFKEVGSPPVGIDDESAGNDSTAKHSLKCVFYLFSYFHYFSFL
jgi:WD40 repeat protein